ncbi:MAG: glycerate kinase [Phycisphaerales bacterium]|nr:glycerate kinase [Phycisphaerales bacterium]
MRFLIAPDGFKESMSPAEAAAAIARGAAAASPEAELDLCPIADGGEGTVEAIVNATGGAMRTTAVRGPLPGMRIDAQWGVLPDDETAIIELPSAAGLALVPRQSRNPLHTTTFGVGELARAAIEAGCTTIIIGLGGSSTCDGGCGLAQALGVRFMLDDGRTLDESSDESMTGAHLEALRMIDRSAAAALGQRGVRFIAANDVTNPLYGPRGSAFIFAPQKGASAADVQRLDRGLRHFASLLPHADAGAPGMGAAGGCTFGITALLGGSLRRGIELVLDTVGFDQRLRQADLVLTGEGRLDEQSIGGKAVSGVAAAAAARGVPVIALVGDASAEARAWTRPDAPLRLQAIHAISDLGHDRDESMRNGAQYLAQIAETALRQWLD